MTMCRSNESFSASIEKSSLSSSSAAIAPSWPCLHSEDEHLGDTHGAQLRPPRQMCCSTISDRCRTLIAVREREVLGLERGVAVVLAVVDVRVQEPHVRVEAGDVLVAPGDPIGGVVEALVAAVRAEQPRQRRREAAGAAADVQDAVVGAHARQVDQQVEHALRDREIVVAVPE